MKQLLLALVLEVTSLVLPTNILAQPNGIMERAFFFKDIFRFPRNAYQSLTFREVKEFSQSFKSSCSNLNRVVLPLYLAGGKIEGKLSFNLYRNDSEKTVFKTSIKLDSLPGKKRINGKTLKGSLKNIWIPPQKDSKGKIFSYKLARLEGEPEAGIWVTKQRNEKIFPLKINGHTADVEHSVFFSYCLFRFSKNNVVFETLNRMEQEIRFILFYFVFIGCLIWKILRARREDMLHGDS